MKGPFACALVLLLSCLPPLSGSPKSRFEVKAAGGTTRTQVGDTLDLTLQPDAITAIDKDCPPAYPVTDKFGRQHLDSLCPLNDTVTVHIPPASVTAFAAGASARFFSITWTAKSRSLQLIFQAKKKDYPSILNFLEKETGRMAVDADAHSDDRPLIALRVPRLYLNDLPDMVSDFKKVCPAVRIAAKGQKAVFTVELLNVETNPLGYLTPLPIGSRGAANTPMSSLSDNFSGVAIYTRGGRRLGISNGIRIKDAVEGACTVITKEWATRAPAAGPGPSQ